MPLTSDALLALIADAGIAARTFSHPSLHTVAESKALRGTLPGAQTRNLFLRDSRKPCYLVTLAEDAQVNMKRLKTPRAGRCRSPPPRRCGTCSASCRDRSRCSR